MKNLALIAGIGGLFVWAYGQAKQKVSEYAWAIQELTYKIVNVHSIRVKGKILKGEGRIELKINLKINNPTPVNFSFNGGNSLSLKKLIFMTKEGKFLAEAKPNISQINLPAKQSIIIKDIPAVLPINKLDDIFNIVKQDFDVSKLEIKAIINVSGTEFEI